MFSIFFIKLQRPDVFGLSHCKCSTYNWLTSGLQLNKSLFEIYEKPKVALCGVRCRRLRCLFKWLVNCLHKACVFLQLRNVVSSSHLQKEHSGELILLNSNNFLSRYKTLCKILYWNIRIMESVVTILGKT